MMNELESTGIRVNLVSPGVTKTKLNGYEGTQVVQDDVSEAVRDALLGPDSAPAACAQRCLECRGFC